MSDWDSDCCAGRRELQARLAEILSILDGVPPGKVGAAIRAAAEGTTS